MLVRPKQRVPFFVLLTLMIVGVAAWIATTFSANPQPETLTLQSRVRRNYTAWLEKAELQQRRGQLSDARRTLETIITSVQGEVTARRRLAELLAGCGYAFEALQPLTELLKAGEANEEDLFRLAVNGNDLFGSQTRERQFGLNPDDPMAIAGVLELASRNRDAASIEAMLAPHIKSHSNLRREAIWRELLYETESAGNTGVGTDIPPTSLVKKTNSLLDSYGEHPESWLIAAEVSRRNNDLATALNCVVQAASLDPWNPRALFEVWTLARGQKPDFEDPVLKLANVVEKIGQLAREIRQGQRDPSQFEELGRALLSIGRLREAKGWARIALASNAGSAWALETLKQGDSASNFVHPVLAESSDLHAEAVASIRLRFPTDVAKSVVDDARQDRFVFHNVAADLGINFHYDNGRLPGQQGLFMHQWTGGGVGVLDLDGDTWPDLCFSQGGRLPDDQSTESFRDAIYRNQRGRAFQEVTSAAIADAPGGFGQGVAVGDVNNDGFNDLYIGRVGRNVLLINQGDGTFQRGHEMATDAWTTSVAIADLNGDANPDIYDVNYLGGENVFVTTCDHGGLQRICGPTDFPAAPDVAWWSNGDETFANGNNTENHKPRPDHSSRATKPQRGMGLTVGRFIPEGEIQIYIANDEGANQLLTPPKNPRSKSKASSFEDVAATTGLAVGANGTALGSMGIAVADVASDGTADFFVTNYYSEPNNLYTQVPPSMFIDVTSQSHLSAAGFSMLGFGCQFADFNADGVQDLIVSNGHLDDFTHLNRPFRMRPQLFRGLEVGRFSNAQPQADYFNKQWLGRAVALIDWNGDRRTDFVVTHIDDRVALVENRSQVAANMLTIRVCGTRSSRDAVGAVIRMTVDNKTQTQWVTAGDGYQCSNQRICRFSRGGDAMPHELQISWPGDDTETISVSSAAGLCVVIEGRKTAYALPR